MSRLRRRKGATTAVVIAAAFFTVSIAVPAMGGPTAFSAATISEKVRRALKISKRANKRSKVAKATAIEALAKAGAVGPTGQTGPVGPAGPQGVAGPQGSKGDPGESAVKLWALIDGDAGTATVERGQGATGASSPDVGSYVVTFDRDITACGIQATLGDATAANGSPGEISIDQPTANSVEVNTYDSAGAPETPTSSNGFYIQVIC